MPPPRQDGAMTTGGGHSRQRASTSISPITIPPRTVSKPPSCRGHDARGCWSARAQHITREAATLKLTESAAGVLCISSPRKWIAAPDTQRRILNVEWPAAIRLHSFGMVKLRLSALARVVAVALLLWAASDLAFPSLCAEDSGAMTNFGNGPAAPAPPQDDCFCCCHHLVPTRLDVPAGTVVCVDVPDAPRVSLSVGVPRALFHPPLPV